MSDHLKFLLYFPGAMIFKILFIKAISKNQYIFKQQIWSLKSYMLKFHLGSPNKSKGGSFW